MELVPIYNTTAKKGIQQADKYKDNIKLSVGKPIEVVYQGFRNNHLRVEMNGDRRFIYAPHFDLKGLDLYALESVPSGVTLDDCTYYWQRDNEIRPTGTCNTSSYAVVFNRLLGMSGTNVAQLEDILSQEMIDRSLQRTWHEHLVKLAKHHGLKARFDPDGTFQKARKQLALGIPVVISGKYTSSGHIVCLVGYYDGGFVVHDPWGDKNTGYQVKKGKFVRYSTNLLRSVSYSKPDLGWCHWFSNPAIDRLMKAAEAD